MMGQPGEGRTFATTMVRSACALSAETAMLRERVFSKANGGRSFFGVLMVLARKTACVPTRAVVTFVPR
jgi:hypothetical protein